MADYDYDLLVIGSGPAGQRAAIQASKLGKRAAIVEKNAVLGGVCTNTGTIPSKTLREAVLYLSGYRERGMYGSSYSVKGNISMADLLFRASHVVKSEIDVTRNQLARNRVDVHVAEATFCDSHTLRLLSPGGGGQRDLSASTIVIATGTQATKAPEIAFDGKNILTSDDILALEQIPRTLAVIGGGVIGLEYASMFAALGTRVTLIDKRDRLLPFIDREITETLAYHLRENRATLRLEEEVKAVETARDERGEHVKISLVSGKHVLADKALYSIGRSGATHRLNLPAAGLPADDRGRLKVNQSFQTGVPHIYAVGDVVGFPALASTSMEQGRLAACHAFGVEAKASPELFPYGIYTIPEISTVGKNEQELSEAGVPYEVGKAQYKEIARGQIVGDTTGLLKILFHADTLEVLGVHIIGEQASELIHIGQAVMAFKGRIDYFVNTVFNYPTLAECYKTAAFDGVNRLKG
jgi:NAD(P) transhydrogenase